VPFLFTNLLFKANSLFLISLSHFDFFSNIFLPFKVVVLTVLKGQFLDYIIHTKIKRLFCNKLFFFANSVFFSFEKPRLICVVFGSVPCIG
jgi:hypothetical protein